ncbi:MAG: LytTR family transcriptional regulator DNA-binding domain-containing protein [Anaerolineales bacterium]|nr:LytTR family transcriptional regulator DNA-binding domain-containing protein [Anaerolineales bacterium]
MMIAIQALQKVIAQQTVLNISELNVVEGEVAAIVGAVDSGREQLASLLLGKAQPTVGGLVVAGLNPAEQQQAFFKRVGVMFPEDGHYARQSVSQNLLFHARLRALPKARVQEVLQEVGLGDQANVRADKLGSGLARRLAFGRAILHQPQVLLLIEPFQRCDQVSLNLLVRLIRAQAEAGTAVLILAEDNAHLNLLCDTVYQLAQGQIVESYQPQEQAASTLPFKVPVRQEGRVVLVNPAEILFADAEEGKAVLHTRQEHLLTQFTLSELEERLARSGFFRAHRSYLVNLQHVKEVIPYTRNSFSLRLDDDSNTEIPLSKGAAGELRELLGY